MNRLTRASGPSSKMLLAQVLDLAARGTSFHAGLAVCYHSVGDPQGNPRTELVPRMGTRLFVRQLSYLRRRFRLVRASELATAAASRRRGEAFPLAITFDDDLSSHRVKVLPLLEQLDIPATFFLTGRCLEGPAWFWWEAVDHLTRQGCSIATLAAVLDRSPPSGAISDVHAFAHELERMSPHERQQVSARLCYMAGSPPQGSGLREADVRALCRRGHEIGFHTLRHEPLTGLDDGELRNALLEGSDRLQEVAGRSMNAIAYPHGKSDHRVVGAARACGWKAGFTTTLRAVTPRDDSLAQGRLDAPFTSVSDLATRLTLALVKSVAPPPIARPIPGGGSKGS